MAEVRVPGAGPPYREAVAAAACAWALYVVTLAPTTAFWDTSEYIATAHILGIPHPPGNPLFVVLAKAWTLLLAPLGLSVAVRVNLLAASTSAAATGFFYLVAHRVLSGIFAREDFARLGAAASALLGATAFTVWNQSTVNEKVYTVSLLVIAAVSWLALLWHDRRDEPGSERPLLWAVFLLALGFTNHPMSVLPVPALGLFVLLSGPGRLLSGPFLGRAAALVVLGLSFNFVLPVRAAQDPVINEGDPTCASFAGAAVAVYTNGRAGCPMLADNLTREQYQTPPVTERKAPFSAQMEMWWQYFDWQWARGLEASSLPGGARTPFTLLFLGLGLAGLWATWRSERTVFVYLAVLAGTLTVALVFYLNFLYGFSLAPEITDSLLHEVRERDYFFVAGFMLWGVLAGIGLAWAWHVVAGGTSGAARYGLASPVLLIALVPLALNWSWASRSGDYAARDWAYDLLTSVEPYGVLFTNGDNDTFPLWYLQEVEGIRRDVTVVVGQYLFTTWYPRQLQDLTAPDRQRPFEPVVEPAFHEPREAPAESIIALEPEAMDRVASVRLPEDATLTFPGIAVTYPAGSVLDRRHQLVLTIIRDSIGQRPIFFSSRGGMLSELGLARWGVRHGLTTKLEMRSLEGPPLEGVVQGSEAYGGVHFALDRSLELYRDIYTFRGLRDRALWPDRSTLSIPLQYYVLALQLADAARVGGRSRELVAKLQEDAAAFRLVGQGGIRGTPELSGGG